MKKELLSVVIETPFCTTRDSLVPQNKKGEVEFEELAAVIGLVVARYVGGKSVDSFYILCQAVTEVLESCSDESTLDHTTSDRIHLLLEQIQIFCKEQNRIWKENECA